MNNVVFFDGVCNLCNSSINFLIDRDKNNKLKFSSLQSEFAHAKLKEYDTDPGELSSVIYLKNQRLYFKSSAILEILKDMGGFFKIFYVFKFILPRFVLDAVYNIVAKNRYKWLGKTETCRIPTKELMNKFIQ